MQICDCNSKIVENELLMHDITFAQAKIIFWHLILENVTAYPATAFQWIIFIVHLQYWHIFYDSGLCQYQLLKLSSALDECQKIKSLKSQWYRIYKLNVLENTFF